jgi:hypothetical protein
MFEQQPCLGTPTHHVCCIGSDGPQRSDGPADKIIFLFLFLKCGIEVEIGGHDGVVQGCPPGWVDACSPLFMNKGGRGSSENESTRSSCVCFKEGIQ